jgi:hypothetical protein
MKSIKTLRFTRSVIAIAVAVAVAGVATNSIATTAPNISGTPDDGMVCRNGYSPVFSAGNIKCLKSQVITVQLECFNPKFPTYVNHSSTAGIHPTSDVCTKDPNSPTYVAITVATPLTNLTESINGSPGVYELAKVNPATVATRLSNLDQSEAAALGLSASNVDTVASSTTVKRDATLGVKDNADVLVTHYTFAVPTAGIVIGPLPTASTFVPRPLQ